MTVKIRVADLEAGDITLHVLKANPSNEAFALVTLHALGLFRIRAERDDSSRFEDLCGDCYNPVANPDIDPSTLAKEKKAFRSRVYREGVWGAVMEVRNTSTAEWGGTDGVDSIWGFVGTDFFGSGYEMDLMAGALDWLTEAGVYTRDRQAALLAVAQEALSLLLRIDRQQPDVFKTLRDNIEPHSVIAQLEAIARLYGAEHILKVAAR